MKKLKLVCLASLLATGMAQAAPCDGYTIKVNNQLADDLLITGAAIKGAELQPDGIGKINSKNSQIFNVAKSTNGEMTGNMSFRTGTMKKAKIRFTLVNNGGKCVFTDIAIPDNDFKVTKTGNIEYTIQ